MYILVFARHGEAAPAEGGPDASRKLTSKGEGQARRRGEKLRERPFSLALTSPLDRAVQTTGLILSAAGKPHCKVMTVEQLWRSSNAGVQEILDGLFARLKYAPLRRYLEAPGGNEAMRAFADDAAEAVLNQLTAELMEENTQCLIGGHAVLHPAIAWRLQNYDLTSPLLDISLGECGAFELNLQTKQVVLLEN